MKVMKFGGTSVGKPERMKQVAGLVMASKEKKIVVLSALSGTTNALVTISNLIANNNRELALTRIKELQDHYYQFIDELLSKPDFVEKARKQVEEHFEFLEIILRISFSEALHKDILAQGELLSTKLFSLYLDENGIDHKLLPALEFMMLDKFDEPQLATIKLRLTQLLDQYPDMNVFVTQGYITRNARGEVDNLKRGGSDYSASLIAAVLQASVCEIWTDIDGMHNNDPRIVENTKPVEQLSFNEAAELAYFGAKILHPASIWPAQAHNVPVKLLNTMEPLAKGTLISADAGSEGAKAIAAKDNITAIKIISSRMLLAYGFLRKVFEVFEKYRTSIDMITTSEVAVSVTIDNDSFLKEIVSELEAYGRVKIDSDHTIVSIVGNEINITEDILSRVFQATTTIPVRMISYGGSSHNISLLIPQAYKAQALRVLHSHLFF